MTLKIMNSVNQAAPVCEPKSASTGPALLAGYADG